MGHFFPAPFYKVNMYNVHNKLASKFVQTLKNLSNSRAFRTLIRTQITQSPWKCGTDEKRAFATDCPENLSNLLRNRSRKFVACGFSPCKMSESRRTVMTTGDVFRLNEYDCVGFDLDNTICRYKLDAMIKLEYDILSDYLVKEKGYDPKFLCKSILDDLDFIQKGLVLDFARGNVLQISSGGYVLKASHGTRFLNDHEIIQTYGEGRQWGTAEEFSKNMLEAWNGPLHEKIRTLLDYFDMPASLVFARIVDSLDAKGSKHEVYNVWPDVRDGLIYMFSRENFMNNTGGYFPALKDDPNKYINKCSNEVLNWLKKIKKEKLTFLITGSHVDFASLVASTSMGEDWRSLFDLVICYARKPGFFTSGRPFMSIIGTDEGKPLKGSELETGNIYSQGNWQDLYGLFCEVTGKPRPGCVYIGDNLIQDVYTPSEYTACDTVAVVEEMLAEGVHGCDPNHPDMPVLVSSTWGSYFGSPVKNTNFPKNVGYSIWSDIIRKHSKLCVPSLEVMSLHPLEYNYPTFVTDSEHESKQLGYYPNRPVNFDVINFK